MSNKNNEPSYKRNRGNRPAVENNRQRNLSFCMSKQIQGEGKISGQTIEEWGKLGLTAKLLTQFKYVGQLSESEAKQEGLIKEYTKVGFPPNSKFKEPKHIVTKHWAVMHITKRSKEVVAGYIDNSIFYIVFLDKDHDFWPSPLKHT